MLLTGVYARTLDAKKRIAIPKPLRSQLSTPSSRTLYLAPGSYQAIWIFTREMLEQFGACVLRPGTEHGDAGAFRRLYFSSVETSDMDRQGRILLPERLLLHAQLHRRVVLLGVHDHLELWCEDKWAAYAAEWKGNFDEMAERAIHGSGSGQHG